MHHKAMKTFLLTALAMLAFAANSILCRLALLHNNIDASSFSVIRIISGAMVLGFLLYRQTGLIRSTLIRPPVYFPLALSVYVIFFSFAYIHLPAASGALVLFTSVQITMMLYSLIKGERYNYKQWFAYALSLAGFFILLLPGAEQPDLLPFLLMVISGIAWGAYTLLAAKTSTAPLQAVQQAFTWSVPIVMILFGIVLFIDKDSIVLTPSGILLAVLSGAIASGLGYFIWYSVLQKITAFSAALAQLTVPVITAIIGILFLQEKLTLQLILAAILIIIGLLINILQQKPQK